MRRVHPLSHTRLSECRGQSNPDPKLVEGAKKQGQMIFYTTMTLDQSKEVVDRFQKKYPFIQADAVSHGRRPVPEHDLYRSSRRQACLGCGGRQSGNGRATYTAKAHASYRSSETK
jgi:hypothetical protein